MKGQGHTQGRARRKGAVNGRLVDDIRVRVRVRVRVRFSVRVWLGLGIELEVGVRLGMVGSGTR